MKRFIEKNKKVPYSEIKLCKWPSESQLASDILKNIAMFMETVFDEGVKSATNKKIFKFGKPFNLRRSRPFC